MSSLLTRTTNLGEGSFSPSALSFTDLRPGQHVIDSLLGSSIGSVLYSIGRVFPFLVDVFSYLFSILSLLFIKTPFQTRREIAPNKLWIEIKEGLVWLWRQPLLRFVAILTFGFNLSTAGINLLVCYPKLPLKT